MDHVNTAIISMVVTRAQRRRCIQDKRPQVRIHILNQGNLPIHVTEHESSILFSCPLGSWVSLWNFETIRGSLMKPKWQKLASLAQEICTL